MRFLPQAILAVLAYSMRIGGTKGLQALWGLMGYAISKGSKGAVLRAQAYTLSRKSAATQAAREARRKAVRRNEHHHSEHHTHHHKEREHEEETKTRTSQRRGNARGRRSKHF